MSDRVFVDTSAYFAFLDVSEREHAIAIATSRRLSGEGAELYTTNFVVAELHALIISRINRTVAQNFIDRLYAGATHVVRATEGDETRAREIIHRHQDKEYSMVDAISFAVMERLHIRLAWSYDQHFAQFGFALAT